ncbi:MAG: hypothetical protein OXD31_17005 [Chloroflexi bacterium]|nr:hypothetical protein [Chloroflexota bacterium]
MIEKVKKELGHSADCGCRGCTNLSIEFSNTNQIIRAADKALTEIGISEVNGKDIAYSALKLFLQRNYRRQLVRA